MLIDIDPVQNVFISQAYTPLAGARPVAGMNVYRTFRANQSADFILLNPVPLTTMEAGKYVALDGHPRPPSTTVLQTTEWDPPSTSLGNLTYVGNGFFVGSRGKDLVFSEPYRPHAWPYAMTFPHGIVAIVAVEGGLLVTTQAQPYVVYGSHPAQMSQQLLNTEQAGIVGRSITTVEGAAIYASHDGLVTVRGGQASLKSSQELFTRKDWRDRYKSVLHNLILCAHDGAVVGLVDPSHPLSVGGATPGFQIRLDEAAQGQYVGVRLDESPIGAFVSSTTDTLFVGYTNGFAEWATGSDLEAMWHSKDFTYPKPEFFSAAKVRGWGTWEVSIYADGEPVTSQMIEFDGIDAFGAEKSFRLPAVGTHTRWSVVFIGRGRIRSFEMGASFAELRHV